MELDNQKALDTLDQLLSALSDIERGIEQHGADASLVKLQRWEKLAGRLLQQHVGPDHARDFATQTLVKIRHRQGASKVRVPAQAYSAWLQALRESVRDHAEATLNVQSDSAQAHALEAAGQSAGPIAPEKVTIAWLVRHVPAHHWIAAAMLLVSAFSLGIAVADTTLVKELRGSTVAQPTMIANSSPKQARIVPIRITPPATPTSKLCEYSTPNFQFELEIFGADVARVFLRGDGDQQMPAFELPVGRPAYSLKSDLSLVNSTQLVLTAGGAEQVLASFYPDWNNCPKTRELWLHNATLVLRQGTAHSNQQ